MLLLKTKKDKRLDQAQEKIILIEKNLKSVLIERDDTVEAIIRGMLSAQNVLLLGPPGTAKSLTIQMMCDHITEGKYFQTLLNKFSTPEDVFGPYSIKKMEDDIFERNIEGWLPDAHFAFLDEVFKANPGVLNSLLSVMNERVYFNGRTPLNIPLFSLIGASNEVPDEDDGLEALYDRFQIKILTQPIRETSGFERMMVTNFKTLTPEVTLTVGEIQHLQAMVQDVKLEGEQLEQILSLHDTFIREGCPVSDRMWKQSLDAIKACAVMKGRDTIQEEDLEFYRFMLWTDPDKQHVITNLIYEEVNPDKQEALKLVDLAVDVLDQIRKNKSPKDRMTESVAGITKIRELMKKLSEIKRKRAKHKADTSDLDPFSVQLHGIAQELIDEVGIDGGITFSTDK